MNDILSLWRSPLDKVAVAGAHALRDRQPRCSIVYQEDLSAITIYNYGKYIYYASGHDPNVALTSMFYDMNPSSQGATGALAFIPQESFAVQAQAFTVPDQSNIVGSGGGGTPGSGGGSAFFHFVVTPAGGSTLFDCSSTAGHTSGGIVFRSLAFQWGSTTNPTDTCIHANMWNVRAVRCTFTDCPRAFNAQALSSSLEQCTISYTAGPDGTNAVVLADAECAVLGPGVFSQTSRASGGPKNCTCISIEGVEHAVVAGMQIYEWATGVDFSQGGTGTTLSTQITNCEIECWKHALNIALPNAGSTAAGIKVTSSVLAKASDSSDGTPIVTIDANGGNLYDVTLLDCTVFNMAHAPMGQHGVSIASGTGIKIIGGTYSNNGPGGGAGIAITGVGPVSDVQIIGANLQPTYIGAPNGNTQTYALLIAGSVSGVLVSGCDMTGYGSAPPVSISGTPSYLLITDCRGYNDVNTPLGASPSQLTAGVSASTSSSPYYGPSVFAYSSATPVTLTVFGQSMTASVGIIFLPNPYDSISFISPPTSFSWTGK